MSLITSRTVLSDRAAVGASARKIVNERAVQGAEAARESENTLSDLQATATQRIQKAVERKSTLKNDTLRNGIVTSRTTLKSLKYSDFDQRKGRTSTPPSDLRPFKNTGASIGQDMTPDTKKGLGFEFERRKQDAIRLGKTMDPRSSPSAQRFLINQTFVNQSVALNQALKGKFKEAVVSAGIGALRIAGVAASAIAQAAGSGTGLRVIQGFVPLNGGYVVANKLAGPFASLIPFSRFVGAGDNQISKANIALRGKPINDGFIGSSEFDRFLSTKDKESVAGKRTSQALSAGSFSTANYLSSAITKAVVEGKIGNFVTGSFSDSSVNSTFKEAGNPSITRSTTTTVKRPENRTKDIVRPVRASATVPRGSTQPVGKVNTYLGQEYSTVKQLQTSENFTVKIPIRVTDDKIFNNNALLEAPKPLSLIESTQLQKVSSNSPKRDNSEDYVDKKTEPAPAEQKGPGKFVNRTTTVAKTNKGDASLESRFYLLGTTQGKDLMNFQTFATQEIKDLEDIIPFTIQNIPATGNPEFLYFRAYLDSMSDSYNGEWSGTRYIGRAEELYNYTGFKRGLQFSFKIAAHSQDELIPLYQKLNRLVGTTAPTYDKGLFMQGVFSKITIGDYVQKLPGFFTSVDLTWQTAYPWEIKKADELGDSIRVPHILDVSVSFQPVHDFAPQYDKTFIGFSSDTVIGQAS